MVAGRTAVLAVLAASVAPVSAQECEPAEVGSVALADVTQDVTVVGVTAAVATGSAGLSLVDISDPEAPVVLGSADTPGNALSVAVRGDVALVADFTGGLGLFDITDAGAPDQRILVLCERLLDALLDRGWPRIGFFVFVYLIEFPSHFLLSLARATVI